MYGIPTRTTRATESGESYAADNLLNKKSAVYVRKKSDDADANSPLYNFSNTKSGPYFSAAPLIELRYAEVLLNFAEVACGAGHMDEAGTVEEDP